MDMLAELSDASAVRTLNPDLGALAHLDCRGVIVTAPGDEHGVDFVSRFFAPQTGVPEDPVTGSAHCALGPYWAERLGLRELSARQVSARGGQIDVIVRGDRVDLIGSAVTVAEGRLLM